MTTTAALLTRTNKYAANCADCAQRVPAGEGVLTKEAGTWKVRHADACPTPPPPARTITATAIGVYKHQGRIYVVRPSRQNKGRVYACELVESAPRLTDAGTEIPFELVYRQGMIYELSGAERMPLAEAEQLATRYARCFVCGTPLKAADSVRRGIGPVCRKYFTTDEPTPEPAVVEPTAAVPTPDVETTPELSLRELVQSRLVH